MMIDDAWYDKKFDIGNTAYLSRRICFVQNVHCIDWLHLNLFKNAITFV